MKSTIIKISIALFAFSLVFTSCFKDDLLREIDDLRTLVITLQQKNDSLNKVINLRADSLSKALTASQKRSDSLAVVLRTKTDSLSQALGITNTNLLNMGKSIDSIKTQLTGINTQLTQLTSQLATANSQIAALSLQLASANADIVALNTKYQQLTTQLQTINAQIAALQAEQAKLLDKLNAILLILNPPADITTGLVAYYPFSGNAGDSSGNGYHGVVNGAILSSDRNGKINSAYHLNSGNFISTNLKLTNISSLTFSGWIKTTNGGTLIGSDALQNTPNFVLGLHTNGTSLGNKGTGIWVVDANGVAVGWMTNTLYNSIYSDGNWHFIAGTFSCQTNTINYVNFNLYVDGNLVNQIIENVQPSSSPINPNANVLFGQNNRWIPFNGNLVGDLDDIRIYNRALTQSEITYLATH